MSCENEADRHPRARQAFSVFTKPACRYRSYISASKIMFDPSRSEGWYQAAVRIAEADRNQAFTFQ